MKDSSGLGSSRTSSGGSRSRQSATAARYTSGPHARARRPRPPDPARRGGARGRARADARPRHERAGPRRAARGARPRAPVRRRLPPRAAGAVADGLPLVRGAACRPSGPRHVPGLRRGRDRARDRGSGHPRRVRARRARSRRRGQRGGPLSRGPGRALHRPAHRAGADDLGAGAPGVGAAFVTGYLRRLLTTGAAYQVADVVSKGIALILLPIYTRHLTRADYGTAELLVTTVILVSIVARLGVGEALVRFHFLDADIGRRRALARTATGVLLAVTTVLAGAVAIFAGPLSEWLLGTSQPAVMRATPLGLWAFTNLQLPHALLRVEERAGPYALASLTNVALTVALTVWLVVVRDEGALGLVAGNYVASAAVLLGLWWVLRDALGVGIGRIDRRQLGPMLRFGLPTVPAEVSVFALFFIDRLWLYRFASPQEAGLFSLFGELPGGLVFTVRAFQYAWPPLAFSIADDAEASRVYARVTTYYVLFTGIVVAGLALLGRWVVRLFAAPEFFAAHEALR